MKDKEKEKQSGSTTITQKIIEIEAEMHMLKKTKQLKVTQILNLLENKQKV